MSNTNSINTHGNYITSSRAAQLSAYSQDYVGQLCRGDRIDCKRVSGEWQVLLASLLAYKQRFNPCADEESNKVVSIEMHNRHQDSIIDGKLVYLSSADASKRTGYSQDYIGQLARSGAVKAKKVGRKWFIEQISLEDHKDHNDGLLAALQASSVGTQESKLSSASSKGTVTEHSINFQSKKYNIPSVTYKSEDGSLLPSDFSNKSKNTKVRDIEGVKTESQQLLSEVNVMPRTNISQNIKHVDLRSKRMANPQIKQGNKAIIHTIDIGNTDRNKIQVFVLTVLMVTSISIISVALFAPSTLRKATLSMGIKAEYFSVFYQSDTGIGSVFGRLTSSESRYYK